MPPKGVVEPGAWPRASFVTGLNACQFTLRGGGCACGLLGIKRTLPDIRAGSLPRSLCGGRAGIDAATGARPRAHSTCNSAVH